MNIVSNESMMDAYGRRAQKDKELAVFLCRVRQANTITLGQLVGQDEIIFEALSRYGIVEVRGETKDLTSETRVDFTDLGEQLWSLYGKDIVDFCGIDVGAEMQSAG